MISSSCCSNSPRYGVLPMVVYQIDILSLDGGHKERTEDRGRGRSQWMETQRRGRGLGRLTLGLFDSRLPAREPRGRQDPVEPPDDVGAEVVAPGRQGRRAFEEIDEHVGQKLAVANRGSDAVGRGADHLDPEERAA